jgi:hypothetical protein
MKKADGLPAGWWWCGAGERQNEQFHRTPSAADGDSFDSEQEAELKASGFRAAGYPCETRRLK